jgi:hypothetical protein
MLYSGLIEALTYFMDLIDMVFMEHLDKFIVVFTDGLLQEQRRIQKTSLFGIAEVLSP